VGGPPRPDPDGSGGRRAGRRGAGDAALAGYLSIQQALSALDRLEVRGRDSAGLHVFVWGHDLGPDDPAVRVPLAERSEDPLFQGGSVRLIDGCLSIVYKAAAEIGELGDNTRALRRAIVADDLLRRALAQPGAELMVLGHTRWASVGIISEPNAHPVNSEELAGPREGTVTGAAERGPYVVSALNGDIDNHADLKVEYALQIPGPITTDAKVIPALISRVAHQCQLEEAFRRSVNEMEGSVAIAAASASEPHRLLLAQRGSGQALYVGLAEDRFIVASEPYGLVEETSAFVRLDGERPADPDRPNSVGQVVSLDGSLAGDLSGIRRWSYDGTELPLSVDDVVSAEVTTRDIDRGDHRHFLLKEITQAPDSLRKTLRGRIVEREGRLSAVLGERTLPPELVERVTSGRIRRVLVVGQGTAAIAGRSMAAVLRELDDQHFHTEAVTATELSGFGLRLDMSDTLIVAVSQSGTTTDTNRTVDLARGRGAAVIAIVNRRQSDLTDKAHGVLYTSDGRDVEMSVASTKAFYAQVAAGVLLACALAELAGLPGADRRHSLLVSLRQLPDDLRAVLAQRPAISDAAHRFAPPKRYWAVVGNGANAVAAHEVRIKLSELCYKSISCDITEDKKHIDLSCEPLILVCAAGLSGGTADDVAKEVAIFRAHKATPIVVATEGEERFNAASAVLTVPSCDPTLAFVLSAMVGHLFGYEAALAIDASARPLREAREAIEHAVGTGANAADVLEQVQDQLAPSAARFFDQLGTGAYDGHLEASTAVRLVTRLRAALAERPLEAYEALGGPTAGPAALVDDLVAALTGAIEELTRPIDAIKHQAKTVTVGISRSDEGVLDRPLVQGLLATGAGRDRLTYRSLKVLADLDPAVHAVVGFTRYAIHGDPSEADATITLVDRGGLALDVPSRVDTDSRLRGTKRRVAVEREVLVARGRRDGRTVILVPEVKGSETTGITLLHVRFHERLTAPVMRGVLQGYDRRYDRLVDWVTETEGTFRDDRLAELDVVELLTAPISETADRWRS
jgi:glutamine---fructose-6-phosphate transaminase (isomerizing)